MPVLRSMPSGVPPSIEPSGHTSHDTSSDACLEPSDMHGIEPTTAAVCIAPAASGLTIAAVATVADVAAVVATDNAFVMKRLSTGVTSNMIVDDVPNGGRRSRRVHALCTGRRTRMISSMSREGTLPRRRCRTPHEAPTSSSLDCSRSVLRRAKATASDTGPTSSSADSTSTTVTSGRHRSPLRVMLNWGRSVAARCTVTSSTWRTVPLTDTCTMTTPERLDPVTTSGPLTCKLTTGNVRVGDRGGSRCVRERERESSDVREGILHEGTVFVRSAVGACMVDVRTKGCRLSDVSCIADRLSVPRLTLAIT
eukprot:PhM_4_TR16742/c1_g1_i8/m.79316